VRWLAPQVNDPRVVITPEAMETYTPPAPVSSIDTHGFKAIEKAVGDATLLTS
jgi:hypothetical protein